jgi:hypothetical protein
MTLRFIGCEVHTILLDLLQCLCLSVPPVIALCLYVCFKQARVLLNRAHSVSKLWDDAPVIVCGDFNCTPKVITV